MPEELEFKFNLLEDAPPSFERLKSLMEPAGYGLSGPRRLSHHDRYFDTPERSLKAQGLALRQREQAGRKLATLKAAGRVEDGVHRREELEETMIGAVWPREIYRRLEELIAVADLRALLEFTTERTAYLVLDKGRPLAELAFDKVTARPPRGASTITFEEVELEALAETSLKKLQAVVGCLKERLELSANAVNKLERAEALLSLSEHLEDS